MHYDEFAEKYLTEQTPVVDLTGTEPGDFPYLIVKHGKYTAVLHFMGQPDHLAVDVHPFVDGYDARAGAFGMEAGKRIEGFTDDDTHARSHGWPAVRLVSVLIGEQENPPPYHHTHDGVPIMPGLRVFHYDGEWGTVEARQFERGGLTDPGGPFFDGWYKVTRVGGGNMIYDGSRMSTLDWDRKPESQSRYPKAD